MIYQGKIEIGEETGNEEHEVLLLGGVPLSNLVREDFKVYHENPFDGLSLSVSCFPGRTYGIYDGKVFVSYFISKRKKPLKKIQEDLVKKISGSLDVDYSFEVYSEYTGDFFTDELTVGGHDLIKELKQYDGQYLTLIIDKENE